MGYFSNGTEGDMYEAQYCHRCAHWLDKGDGDGAGCPVLDVHMLWNYEQCSDPRVKSILDRLIPPTGGGYNGKFPAQCAMFIAIETPTPSQSATPSPPQPPQSPHSPETGAPPGEAPQEPTASR